MESVRIQPAYDGVDTESSPDYVDAAKAPVVENLLGRPGKLVMRGPLRRSIVLATTEALDPAAWAFGDRIAFTRNDGNQDIYTVDLPSGSVTLMSANLTLALRDQHTRLGNFIYGFIDDGAAPIHKAVNRWSGATGPSFMTLFNNGPTDVNGGQTMADIRAHLQRLFVLGGAAPGTVLPPAASSIIKGVLWFSDPHPDAGFGQSITHWQDDVSGLVNQIRFDAFNENPTALAQAGRNLYVLMTDSVRILVGDAPSNWVLRTLTTSYGCKDRQSVVEAEDGIYFVSRVSGFVYTDGSQVRVVSGPVQAELLAALQGLAATNRGVYAVKLPNDYIFLSVTDNGNPAAMVFAAMFHTTTGAWFKISCDAAINTLAPVAVTNSFSYPIAVIGKKLWLLDEISIPEITPASGRGFDDNAGTGRRIPAKWYSRLQRLSSPNLTSQLSRLLFDYAWVPDGAASEQNGWFVSVVDGQGTVLIPEFQVPGQLDPPTQLFRRRHQIENFAEATDAQIRVEWKGTPFVGIEKAEIYDATLEFQPGRKRPKA